MGPDAVVVVDGAIHASCMASEHGQVPDELDDDLQAQGTAGLTWNLHDEVGLVVLDRWLLASLARLAE
eukprot:13062-Eustigmatos_ZCMA.PRE.1